MTILLGMIFIISSSGYTMYKINCSCTGEEQISVFVRPATCEETFHQHHKHDKANNEISSSEHECHECLDHTNHCGCNSPEIYFFKLKDKAVDDEVKFVAQVTEINLNTTVIDLLFSILELELEIAVDTPYNDPPSKITSSLDFLISINQLKIPALA